MKHVLVVGVGVMLLMAAGPAAAHHSFAMFDASKTQSLEGTVAEFAWTNPHASIQIDVPNTSGGMDRWGVEMGSPNALVRHGWKSSIIKPGDKVTIVVRPLKSGEHGGAFVSLTLADGRVLTAG